jgi:ion channel-forming bestrophin family protein
MIHYDPHRWLDHFFDIKGSLVKEIGGRVTLCVAWTVAVVLLHKNGMAVSVSAVAHTLVGVALGLLLVFRTNASYDRFWEGRRLWGSIVNDCRNLVRMAAPHLRNESELLSRLTQLTALFPVTVMKVLRGESDWPANLAWVRTSQHPALTVSLRMSECLLEGRRRDAYSDIIHGGLEGVVKSLVDQLGGCERIRKTPLPFAYVVHLRRALVIYCLSLPFALVDPLGWEAVLAVLFISYTFFGIEEIGVEIEGPFGYDDNDLPLDDICKAIHDNVFSIAGIESTSPEQLPEGL